MDFETKDKNLELEILIPVHECSNIFQYFQHSFN